jgi:hypothetical protein
MIMFGIIGVGQTELRQSLDLSDMFKWGQIWLNGLNAYEPKARELTTFDPDTHPEKGFLPQSYPPHAASLFTMLASFSFKNAELIMRILNIFCVGMIAFFSILLLKQAKIKELNAAKWFIPAFIMSCPFTSNVIWQGQTGLLVTAALIGSWYFAHCGKWILGGIFIAIASMKPHLSLLVIIWLLLDRQWRLLTVAAITALCLSLIPMLNGGVIAVFWDWYMVVTDSHFTIGANKIGSQQILTIQGVLYVAGIKGIPTLFPLGVILTGVLWWHRSKFLTSDTFGILLGMTILLGYSHIYDWVVLIPLIPIFWIHLHKSIDMKVIVAIGLMFIIFFPRRWIRYVFSDQLPDLLFFYRVPILLVITIWLLIMSLRHWRENQS